MDEHPSHPALSRATSPMHTYVIGDSTKANSLGRTLSLALTASEMSDVSVLAFNDGPVWAGATQFPFSVRPFARRHFKSIRSEVRDRAAVQPTTVWVSKGAHPLPSLVRSLKGIPNLAVIADFDDDDVAIMKVFAQSSFINRLKANPTRRKSPQRLGRSQRVIASLADILSFSSAALGSVYRDRWGARALEIIVPHTRADTASKAQPPASNKVGVRLRVGFIGTLRSYKGADEITALLRYDSAIQFITFSQEWMPPADVASQWNAFPPDTPLHVMYSMIDVLILPMDPTSPAAKYQLPAKLVDAAVHSCAVAATPTDPIEEFAANAYLRVTDWSDPEVVLHMLLEVDKISLGRGLRKRYDQAFSPEATAQSLASGLGRWRKQGFAEEQS